MPSEYEIVTSGLLYYRTRPFEVVTPGGAWLERHQLTALSFGIDWETFDDPRSTTYHAYVTRRSAGEAAADATLRSIVERRYDQGLAAQWVDVMESILPVLRFPLHGLQMAEAYVAHLAPSGKLVVQGLFQAGDTMRLIQRFAQRMSLVRRMRKTFGDQSRSEWEKDPAWQPLRETIETLLVTYEWLDAYVALNLAVKPALDRWIFETFRNLANQKGDPLLAELLFTMAEDAEEHRQVAAHWEARVHAASPEGGAMVDRLKRTWTQRASAATSKLSTLILS
jgi:toluene monooxygenase system protein E